MLHSVQAARLAALCFRQLCFTADDEVVELAFPAPLRSRCTLLGGGSGCIFLRALDIVTGEVDGLTSGRRSRHFDVVSFYFREARVPSVAVCLPMPPAREPGDYKT